ncbi:hypothetical protein FPQ18DRAFT_416743, partial [Pyronema domesticum]
VSTQVLKLQKRVLGPEHPDTLCHAYSWFSVYNDNKFAEAISQLQSVQKLREKVLGPTHTDTLTSMEVCMKCNTTCQSITNQLSQLKLGVKMARKTYGQFHPNTAQIVFNYAHACKSTAPKDKEHITRMKEALLIIKKLCGDQHPQIMEWRDILAHWK